MKCPECKKGELAERSLYDDWEGYLTCNHCNTRIKSTTVTTVVTLVELSSGHKK